ncbi:hypothetical protein ACFLZX_04400 [Nanoarchaeota archaeon]
MKLDDFKNKQTRERRLCRANLRLYPSQMKFINDNGLPVQEIFDKALYELGHDTPKPEEVDELARIYGNSESRGHGRGGKGNVRAQKARAKRRKRH